MRATHSLSPCGRGRGGGVNGADLWDVRAREKSARPTPHPSPLPQGEREKRALRSLPIWIVVIFCSGLPLLWIAAQIVTNPHVLVEAWPDLFRLKLLGRTLLFNFTTAFVATILGLPVGLVLG